MSASPDLFHGQHETVAGLSQAVQLKYSPDKGRHLVAAVDIPAGSVVIDEASYGVSVFPVCAPFVCQYCLSALSRDTQPLLCPTCQDQKVRFCSPACLDRATAEYHRFDCRLDYAGFSDFTFVLGLRILLRTGIADLADYFGQCQQDPDWQYRPDQPMSSERERFLSIQSLTRIPRGVEAAGLDLLIEDIVQQLLLRQYFDLDDWPTSMTLAERQNVVAFCLREIYVRQKRNRQGIHTGGLKPEFDDPLVQRIVNNHDGLKAVGLYPVSVIMNHCCRPNTHMQFGRYGRVTVRAIRPIRRGQQLCHNYGPRAGNQLTEDRRHTLRTTYYFECQCEAAQCFMIEHFPPLLPIATPVKVNSAPLFAVVTCERTLSAQEWQTTEGRCAQCGCAVDVDGFERLSAEISDHLDNGNASFATIKLVSAAASHLHDHNLQLYNWRKQLVDQLTAQDQLGSTESLLIQLLPTCALAHGQHSLKYANLLRMLSRVYSVGHRHSLACGLMSQAIGIYVKYHGLAAVLDCSHKPQWQALIKAMYPRLALAVQYKQRQQQQSDGQKTQKGVDTLSVE